ncbi:MAG: Phosphohistidine phosphatase SixA [Candidatus Alkanophagales archaeon MCA70_species_1]|nr:Phosphohistidine phosphatase SixA [Candidatus Alkanophaga volatiphilum]
MTHSSDKWLLNRSKTMVRVYSAQHGEARSGAEDPARPLTDKGKEDAKKVANYVSKFVRVERILHSGKLRAVQTAEIMADALKPPKGVEQTDTLEP